MVEPIRSREVLGKVQVSLGEAPKHTHEDHRRCAYYAKTEQVAEDVPDFLFIDMECPHGASAGGAFYNEDYVRQLKQTIHILLELLPSKHPINHSMVSLTRQEVAHNFLTDDYRGFLGPYEPEDLGYLRSIVEELEELSK